MKFVGSNGGKLDVDNPLRLILHNIYSEMGIWLISELV